jgi:D-alanyl-lipoteichoic acid acyltransferase DltB (MBOAT superfamily)
VAAYAFTWQIYCDFSGYTDIARGVARLFGVDLSLNFRLPFFATSPRELWRRWHISLSQWLRDYLYIPLGGGRRGRARVSVNLMITMLLGGLWHGANWTFLVWGGLHGLALVLQRWIPFPDPRRWGWPGRVVAIVLTFHFTCAGFVLFRAHDLGQAWALLLSFLRSPLPAAGDGGAFIQLVALISLPLLVECAQHVRGDDLDLVQRLPALVQVAFSVLLFLAIVVLGATHGHSFIYFQF